MAGKKDQALVVVLTDMTPTQAGKILDKVVRAKAGEAPLARGTAVVGPKNAVGKMLADGREKLQLGAQKEKEAQNGRTRQLTYLRAKGG